MSIAWFGFLFPDFRVTPQFRIAVGFGLGVLLFAIGGFVEAGDTDSVTFSAPGRPDRLVDLVDLAGSIDPTRITLRSPENGLSVTYEGYAFEDVLRFALGRQWSRYSTIEFTCLDGYQPRMATALVSQRRGVLAVREVGKPGPMSLRRSDGTLIDLGKFYLVWDNLNDIGARDNATLAWPWQIKSISLVNP